MTKLKRIVLALAIVSMGLYLSEKGYRLLHSVRTKPHYNGSCELTDLLGLLIDFEKPGLCIIATNGVEPGTSNVWTFPSWNVGANPDTPIMWTTEGHSDEPPAYLGTDYGCFARHGTVVLTWKNKPLYEELKRTIVPGAWDIWLVGPNAAVYLVYIESGSSIDLPFNLPQALRSAGFTVSLFRGVEERSTTYNFIIYRVETPRGGRAWIADSWSIGGTGDGSQMIYIMYGPETMELLWENESKGLFHLMGGSQ